MEDRRSSFRSIKAIESPSQERAIFIEHSNPCPTGSPWLAPLRSTLNDALSQHVILSPEEEQALGGISCAGRDMKADHTLVRQGGQQAVTFVILSGLAVRYRYLASGKRQVFGYLLPGDVCDAQFFVTGRIDHDIALASDATIAVIPTHELSALAAEFPNIRLALVRSIAAESASLREWVCNLGQRNAPQRLAHFLCEIWDRVTSANGPDGGAERFVPLSQLDIADALGLTVAHTSRCMQQLRKANLIIWSRRALAVMDIEGLRKVAGPPN